MRIKTPAWLGAATALAMASAAWGQPTAAEDFAPAVDHHQHLLSQAGAAMINAAPAPQQAIPPEIAALLAERAARWNEAAGLAPLYDAEATALDSYENRYVQGREAVAGYLSTLFARAFRLTPTAYLAEGESARLHGYYSRDTDAGVRHFGHFNLTLARDPGGAWRIASEDGIFPGPAMDEPITAARLTEMLDEAGIRRAVVLSIAYWFDAPDQPDTPENYARVQAENDWTLAQTEQFPERLIPFCSVNPVRDHAIAELERCAALGMRGLKLHFDNSEVDLANPDHLTRVRALFGAANRLRLPIVVHTRDGDDFGRAETLVLLDEVIPAAPDIVVQIAHLWGGGAYSGDALAAFAEAFAAGRPATRNLYFDVTDAAFGAAQSEEQAAEIARHMRQIGLDRMLYGSDAAMEGHGDAEASWTMFRGSLPLSDAEYRAIAANIAPYLRD